MTEIAWGKPEADIIPVFCCYVAVFRVTYSNRFKYTLMTTVFKCLGETKQTYDWSSTSAYTLTHTIRITFQDRWSKKRVWQRAATATDHYKFNQTETSHRWKKNYENQLAKSKLQQQKITSGTAIKTKASATAKTTTNNNRLCIFFISFHLTHLSVSLRHWVER